MNVLIVDDEQAGVDSLKILLEEFCEGVTVVGTANNIEMAKKELDTKKVDLLFLDIEMPGGTGFDLLEMIPNPDFAVVFTTAYQQYAIEAVRSKAIDYLLKPIDEAELQKAINNARKALEEKTPALSAELVGQLQQQLSRTTPEKTEEATTVTLPTSDGYHFVKLDDIIRVEAQGSYSEVITLSDGKLLISKNLSETERLFDNSRFIRIHKKHLINKIHVKSYAKAEGGYLVMVDDSRVDISRRKKDVIADLFG